MSCHRIKARSFKANRADGSRVSAGQLQSQFMQMNSPQVPHSENSSRSAMVAHPAHTASVIVGWFIGFLSIWQAPVTGHLPWLHLGEQHRTIVRLYAAIVNS